MFVSQAVDFAVTLARSNQIQENSSPDNIVKSTIDRSAKNKYHRH